jgi:hypothetical protein
MNEKVAGQGGDVEVPFWPMKKSLSLNLFGLQLVNVDRGSHFVHRQCSCPPSPVAGNGAAEAGSLSSRQAITAAR